MSNPVMLITGASSGIGAATALLAAERGYDLVITYLSNRVQAETVAQKIIASHQLFLCSAPVKRTKLPKRFYG